MLICVLICIGTMLFNLLKIKKEQIETTILFNQSIDKLQNHIDKLQNQINEIDSKLKKLDITNKSPIKVKVTGYTTARNECGPHTPYGASGKKVKPGMAAVSHDLKKKIKYGTKIHLKGIGVFVVQDLMNKRWTKKIDLVMSSKKEAYKFGIKETQLIILD